MTLFTSHNEHQIRYDEHRDEWLCTALDIKAKSLSALKIKLNDFDAKERRLSTGINMINVSPHRFRSKSGLARVRATMIDRKDVDKYPMVWVSYIEDGEREKISLGNLVPETPENVAILQEIERLLNAAKELNQKADALREGMKRLTVDEIKALALEVKPE